MKEYIHYGHKSFDKVKFRPVENYSSILWTKPTGGLWASAVDSKYGWKYWCELNEFRECNDNNSFKFTLSKNAEILHIYSVNDLKDLPCLQVPDHLKIGESIYLDFEVLQSKYDAIELHLSEENEDDYNSYMNSLYYKLYGWDCDSILIMNPDIVCEIQENLLTEVL